MKSGKYIALWMSTVLVAACTPGTEQETPTAAKATPAPRTVLELPAGAHMSVIMDTALSSKTSQAGDRVEAHLSNDLVVNTWVVARAGSRVTGRVISAVPSGRVKTRARLAFVFDSIVVEGGARQPVETQVIDITANDSHKRDAITIGGGAGAGALIGAMFDGGKGAGIGALIGAGAGTGVVLVDKGKNVRISTGGRLNIKLLQALKVSVPSLTH